MEWSKTISERRLGRRDVKFASAALTFNECSMVNMVKYYFNLKGDRSRRVHERLRRKPPSSDKLAITEIAARSSEKLDLYGKDGSWIPYHELGTDSELKR